jgi:hypothetical protein
LEALAWALDHHLLVIPVSRTVRATSSTDPSL